MTAKEVIERLEEMRDFGGWTGLNDYYRPAVEEALKLLKNSVDNGDLKET